MLPSFAVLLTAAAALAAVLGAVVLLGRLARRAGLARSHGRPQRLALKEVLALDARRRLHIISCDGRECLVLTAATGDLVLGWLEPPR